MNYSVAQTQYNNSAYTAASNAINSALGCVLPDLKVAKWSACGTTGWMKFSKADPSLKIETRVATTTGVDGTRCKLNYRVFVTYAGMVAYDSGLRLYLKDVVADFSKWCVSGKGRRFPSIAKMVVEEYKPKSSNVSIASGDIINIHAAAHVIDGMLYLNNYGSEGMRILVSEAPSQDELLSEDPNTVAGKLRVLSAGYIAGPPLDGCGLTWMYILSNPFNVETKRTKIEFKVPAEDVAHKAEEHKPDFLPPNGSAEVRAPWPIASKAGRRVADAAPIEASVSCDLDRSDDPPAEAALGEGDRSDDTDIKEDLDGREKRLRDNYRTLRQRYLMSGLGNSPQTERMTLLAMDKIWIQLSPSSRWLVANA